MSPRTTPRKNREAFTLVEMIGVLAIIATLAGVLLPRVFQAITDSQVNSVAQTVGSMKTAISKFYADNNSFPANVTALMTAGLIEKPLSSPIGTAAYVSGTADGLDLATAANIDGGNFDLSGDGTTTVDTPSGSQIAYITLTGVSKADAEAINDLVDGDTLGDDDDGSADNIDELGQVIYDGTAAGAAFPNAVVYIYVAHR